MNLTICSYQPTVWLIWLSASLFVFLVEAVKSYLIQFRYRELRADTRVERKRLTHLFSIIDEPKIYRRTFGTTLLSIAVACAGAAWVLLLVCSLQGHLTGVAQWVANAVIVWVLILSAIVHGLCLKWLPVALGPRMRIEVIQIATFYVVFFSFLLRPIRIGVNLGIRFFKWIGIKEFQDPEPMDRDFQILAIGREDVKFTSVTEKIAGRAIELSSISVYDILLPRNQVQIFDLNESVAANLEKARKTGHTRFPLCNGDLDQCEGLIHIKDIFRFRKSLDDNGFRKIARPILRVGEEEPLDKVLQILLTKRVHMALVEDEFGGVLGVLTLERILEELVGEIQDEFDKEDKMIVPLKKDFYKISGITPLHEVEDQLGVDNLENDDVSSFGGLITHHLGRIPEKGEQLEIGSLSITIKETDETRVISTTVRLNRISEESNDL